MRIVYSPHYNISFMGLENLHPFDSKKYGRAWSEIKAKLGKAISTSEVKPPRPVSPEELSQVHTSDYLEKIKSSEAIAEILEIAEVRSVPFWLSDRLILKAMRWACMGSMVGAVEAKKHGLAVNLGGGYHHASATSGGGFCVYSDIALAIEHLRKQSLLSENDTVVYIDLDAHQGDGVCHTYMTDQRIKIFDIYNEHNFTNDRVARSRIDWDVPVNSAWSSKDYLLELKSHLPEFLDDIAQHSENIGFAIYNAGNDVLDSDPLGELAVTAADVVERDHFVIKQLRQRNIHTLMLPSGGYTKTSYQVLAASVLKLIENGY